MFSVSGPRFLLWGALLTLRVLLLPTAVVSQELQGLVRDQRTGTPVVNVLVRVDSLGDVTLTDLEGRFAFRRLPKGRYTLSFQAMGYDTLRVSVQVPADTFPEILLRPRPIELEGIRVEVPGVLTRMDMRLARLPGYSRVVNPERVRAYDTIHAKDPWKLLWRELRVGWDYNAANGAIRIRNTPTKPEVYLDDHKTWLLNVVLMPNALLCRVELYRPLPFMGGSFLGRGADAMAAAQAAFAEAGGRTVGGAAGGVSGAGAAEAAVRGDAALGVMTEGEARSLGQVPLQIRAYTCLFMAEVIAGERTLRRNVNWGDLIAGPDAFPSQRSGWGGAGGSP
jgi:hypothetical protein